jgi:signal transduction histidine kinase
MEYRIQNKDGSYHWVIDSGKAVLDSDQKPVRMVGSIIDITERKKAEEKIKKQKDLLEKVNAELDRFVYITSHDLKAPLLSIQGLINLAEISDDKAEIDHCLNMMKERVKGLENFISDIISYSRNVRSGIVKEEVNLKNVIKSIVDELLYMKGVEKLKIHIDMDSDLTMLSDEKRLNVILKNLVFNAIKYHNYDQENPEIWIEAEKLKNQVKIRIRDNGEGIRKEQLNKIFEMFYRASEKSNGSGLGLYIVKEMTSKLNGSVEVESTHGKGSEFTVTLPLI